MKKINKGSKKNKTAFHFVKTKLGFVGVVIVLVVLAVSLCALLSSCVSPTTVSQPPSPSYQELLSSPTPPPSPTASLPSPTPTSAALQAGQMVGWKVYANAILGYEIQYPKDWQLRESASMGYPYVKLLDPTAQAHPPGTTELSQGAIIEISAEEYKATVSVNDYLRNFVPTQGGDTGKKLTVQTDELTSTVWGRTGPHLVFRGDNFLQYNHASLITYPKDTLLLQVKLTVLDVTEGGSNMYLDTFNQMLASLRFTPPPTMPERVR